MMTMFSHRRFFGLDIGNSAVKIAEISIRGGKVSVERLLKMDLPAMADDLSDQERRDLISSAVRNLCQRNGLLNRQMAGNLSGAFVASRLFALPSLSQEELVVYFQQHAQEYLPARVNLSEVEFDFQVLKEEMREGKEIGQIILAAARKQAVDDHMKLMEGAGVFPGCMDASSMSLINTFSLNPHLIASKLLAIIDVGHLSTKVLVVKDRILSFAIEFPLGGDSVTKALQARYALDSKQAEELKHRLSGIGNKENDEVIAVDQVNIPAQEAVGSYRQELDKMAEEIKKIRQYHGGGKNWQRIILTGGGAKTKGLAEVISAGLAYQAEVVKSLEGVLYDDTISESIPEFSLAIGLALKQVNPLINSINLLPEAQRQRIDHNKTSHDIFSNARIGGILLVGTLSLFLLFGGFFYLFNKFNDKKALKIKTQWQVAKAVRDLNRQIKDYLSAGEKLPGGRNRYSYVMFQMSKMIPQGLWLNSLAIGSRMKAGESDDIEQIPQITVSGNCDAEQPAIEFLKTFEKSPLFSSPELKFMEKGKASGGGPLGSDQLKFEIKAVIKTGGTL
jgi:type IV pilus assembly protein PilM